MAQHTARRLLTALPAAGFALLPAACVDEPAGPLLTPPSYSTEGVQGAGAPGSIVFHSDRAGNREIYLMSPGGEDPVRLTDDPAMDYYPDISPNGRYVVFTSNRAGAKTDIYLLDLQGGSTTDLTNTPAANEDWARFSPNGQQVAFHSDRTGNYEIFVLDLRTGVLTQATSYAGVDQWAEWSPDGNVLAIRRDTDVYLLELATGAATRLTTDPALDQMAAWSHDGKQLAFMSARAGYCSVFVMNADGSGQTNLTPKDAADANNTWCSRAPSWTRNGEILFMSFRPAHAGNNEIYIMNADGTGLTRLTNSAGEDGGPTAR